MSVLTTRAIVLRGAVMPRRYMSARPPDIPIDSPRKKVTLQSLHNLRQSRTPITMLTAYDYPTALTCSASNVDITLVGDSLAQVCLGYTSTVQLTLTEMIHHARAVSRGTSSPFLVADMPFGTYHASIVDTMRNAVRLVQEGCVDGVKMEGGRELVSSISRLTAMGIPVMAHVGLLPQRHTMLSGYKVQGRDAESARALLHSAIALQDAGAFAIVLEAVPWQLGTYITQKLSIPTIGIGAGPGTSGQVLVFDDVMSSYAGHKPKFVRRFADVGKERGRGAMAYVEAVKAGKLPQAAEVKVNENGEKIEPFPRLEAECYVMDEEEWTNFLSLEGETEGQKGGL